MTITESGLYPYRQAAAAQKKWAWANTAWFILLTCGAFWAALAALVFALV